MLQPRPLFLLPLRPAPSHLSLKLVHGPGYATVRHTPGVSLAVAGKNSLQKTADSSKPEAENAVVRSYKPRTPGLRHLKRPINDHLWKGRAFLPLTYPKKGQSRGGRNVSGKITVRHRGGGHKRRIRVVDFERRAAGPHVVERIEYDPNRTAHIALVAEHATGIKSYILAPEGMRAGDVIQSYRAGLPQELIDSMGGVIDPAILASKTAFRGNCLPLHMVPAGTTIFNIGSRASGGGVFCRSAGTFGVVMSKDDSKKMAKEREKKRKKQKLAEEAEAEGTELGEDAVSSILGKSAEEDTAVQDDDRWVHVRLQSGEVRKINRDSCCTIGLASNVNYHLGQLGKAGRKRWLGIRPTVRGVAMNKVDHPHGGGRGKSKSNRIPTSPWGTIAKSGFKTRDKHKVNKFLVVPRPRNFEKRKDQGL